MKKLWRDHSLSIVVALMSIAFIVISLITTHEYWVVEGKKAHGDFFNYWLMSIGHEFVGEMLIGVLAIIWLTKELREEGSPEAGQEDENPKK